MVETWREGKARRVDQERKSLTWEMEAKGLRNALCIQVRALSRKVK